MNLRLVAVALAALSLAACQEQAAVAQYTHDQNYPDSVLMRKFGIEHVLVGTVDNADCYGDYGYGYRVNFIKNGKVYSGLACHEFGGTDWTLEIDTGSVLLNDAPQNIPAPPPATTPQS